MISIRSLSKSYGQHQVLRDVSLEIAAGETVALLGPSGSGKTTLLRSIVGLETFDAGELAVDNVLLQPGKNSPAVLRDVRRRCGLVFQQYNLFPHKTVLQNLVLAPVHVHRVTRVDAEARGRALLEQVGLAHKAEQRPNKLSGGEQQRVAIARALATQPGYLLYDEPTSALDNVRAQEIWNIMRILAARGLTQVIVTHQEQLAEALQCRVVRMDAGRVRQD
jgi:ABC-type polar amino acid transport system ATPase subunit